MTLQLFLVVLDYASVLVFALSGALVASRQQLDPVGFIFMAVLTAVGGGTLRDLVLDRGAVFWVERPSYILIAAAAAMFVFWTAHLLESRYRWIRWLDAVALSVAVSAGVGTAMDMGSSNVIIVLMGVMTGTFGGLMRDVVGNEVPLVLKPGELYLTAAFVGSVVAATLVWFGLARGEALVACAIATLIIRFGSIIWGWSLPGYKHLPPKQ